MARSIDQTRWALETAVEAALAVLDAIDGDPDLEDDDREDIDEREADHGDLCCWRDEGDQTHLGNPWGWAR